MTCRHVNDLRDSYLDGELSPSLTAEVHAHLLQCPACQQQFEMLRACGDLIAQDSAEPELDGGFASRVVAMLPRQTLAPVLMTRRDNRQRFMKIFAGAGLPAAAAMLFLSVLIWPTSPEPQGVVLPEAVEATLPVEELVGTPIDAWQDTKSTFVGVRNALVETFDRTNLPSGTPGDDATTQPSLLDAFLSPFKDALTPPTTEAGESDKEVVRF